MRSSLDGFALVPSASAGLRLDPPMGCTPILLIHNNLRYRKINEEVKNNQYGETREQTARSATSWKISRDALV